MRTRTLALIATLALAPGARAGDCVRGEAARISPAGPAIAAQGDLLVLGDPRRREVHPFRFEDGAWMPEPAIGSGLGDFGTAVAIDGDILVVGDPEADDEYGAAYLYRRIPDEWVFESKLTAVERIEDDSFGFAVAVSGPLVAIGAPRQGGLDMGAVYVFRFNGQGWIREDVLTAADGAPQDRFGWSLDVNGINLLVGAPLADPVGNLSGAVYAFRREGGWVQKQKLFASNGAERDRYGWSLDVGPAWAVVGAPFLDDDEEENTGSAYILRYDGQAWFEEAVLANELGPGTVEFGLAVAIDGPTALVAADVDGFERGRARVYRHDDGTWPGIATLATSDNLIEYAHGAALDDGRAFVSGWFQGALDLVFEFDVASCEACVADLNDNGEVGLDDLLVLLAAWGPCPKEGDCPADFDEDGDVGIGDLLLLLATWGPCIE